MCHGLHFWSSSSSEVHNSSCCSEAEKSQKQGFNSCLDFISDETFCSDFQCSRDDWSIKEDTHGCHSRWVGSRTKPQISVLNTKENLVELEKIFYFERSRKTKSYITSLFLIIFVIDSKRRVSQLIPEFFHGFGLCFGDSLVLDILHLGDIPVIEEHSATRASITVFETIQSLHTLLLHLIFIGVVKISVNISADHSTVSIISGVVNDTILNKILQNSLLVFYDLQDFIFSILIL